MNVSAADINQFASFVKFADTMGHQTRTVARLSDDLPGLGGTQLIAANTNDRAFAFTRSAANKTSNNEVRNLFLKTVANLFGGDEANIPESVRNKMKLSDYNKGRPLTAKRIRAVELAVMNYFLNEDRLFVNGKKVSITAFSDGIDIADTTDNSGNIINTTNSINDDGDEDYGQITTNNKKLKTLANELNKKVEAFNPQKKTIVNNSNVSGGEVPKTFDDKMKMFQKKNVVFGQAGFVPGKGNPVMEGRKTGTNDIKNDTHDTENVEKKYDNVQVVKKPKTKKPITFTED